MKKILELENVLLDQIEKINDDSVSCSEEECVRLINRSKAISDLADNVIQLNRLKLDIVKASEENPAVYQTLLDKPRKKSIPSNTGA